MDFVKVTEIIEDLDVIGEVGTLTHDGVILAEGVAAYAYQFSEGTFLAVDDVTKIDGGFLTGANLFAVNLPEQLTIEDIAAMSALDLLRRLCRENIA